jgi:hypothetical protein
MVVGDRQKDLLTILAVLRGGSVRHLMSHGHRRRTFLSLRRRRLIERQEKHTWQLANRDDWREILD